MPPAVDPPEPPELAVQRAVHLNPEAGDHVVTADPRALDAVERAALRSYARFPYLQARFGARGRAFTRSDGGWLVTLAEHDAKVVRQQIEWLAQVLAARGMPRLILEEHLRATVEALEEVLPEHHEGWTRLRAATDALTASRRTHLPDALLAARARALDAFVGAPDAGPPDAAELLAAAVADERAKLANAVSSLLDWLAAPGRFSTRWREALLALAAEWRGG